MWKFCKMQKIERVVDVPVVMHWLFTTIQNKKKRSLNPSESFVKNQIACSVRIVFCERRPGRKSQINVVSSPRIFVTSFLTISPFFTKNKFLCERREVYTEHFTSHAHFSRCLASLCQFVSLRSVVSSLFTCTTRACGSRYKLFFVIHVSCAHPNKIFSIHTSCLSLVFRLCLLSVRLHHHPRHLLHRR